MQATWTDGRPWKAEWNGVVEKRYNAWLTLNIDVDQYKFAAAEAAELFEGLK